MTKTINTDDTRRKATWYDCGTDISKSTSIKEALQISGLDYEVVKAPVYLSTGYKIPGQFCTKKKCTNDVFGIVGKDYTVVQNDEAFSFVEGIIPEGLRFEKAGESSWMNWILASLPEQYVLGDKMVPYVIFQNSHAGGTCVKASISPLRLACSNQFTIAFKEAAGKVKIKHTHSVHDKLVEAQQVLSEVADYMDVFKAKAEGLAAQKVSDAQFTSLLEVLFPINEDLDTTRKQNSMQAARQALTAAYKEDDLQNFQGTKWGIINAYSDFITHKDPGRKTDSAVQSRFMEVTLNPHIMKHFMDMLNAIA